MKIIGFTISGISAERKAHKDKEKIEIKSNLNIEDIQKENVEFTKNDSLKFDFSYNIGYEPELAAIKIKGSVIVMDDKDESKDILKEWKKKKFDHPLKLPLFNFIMNKCNIKTLQLEEELGLPFHMPMPQLASQPIKDQNSNAPINPAANYTG